MSTKARRDAIHDVFSKKINQKKKKAASVKRKELKNPPIPPTVNNYEANNPVVAKSLNQHPAPVHNKRNIAKTEGMPAVNGKSGEKVVKKAVTRVKSKDIKVDEGDAAIGGKNVKSKTTKNVKKRTSKSRQNKSEGKG